MNWRKILTISAVILAGILVYTLYLYLGPYRKLSKENRQLKQEIEARIASESEMGEELGTTKAELTKKTRLAEDLQAEIGQLREAISKMKGQNELAQELEQLKDEYQNLENEAEHLRQTITTVEAERTSLKEESSDLKKQLRESGNRRQVASQEMAVKKKELEEVRQIHQVQVEGFKKEVNEKTERLNTLEKEIGNLKEEHQQKVQGLQGQLAQRDQKIQILEKETEQLRQTITTLETNKTALN